MNENHFETGEVVKHVHPDFSKIKLYVVKKLDNARYKCRYLQGDVFRSDEFEVEELVKFEEKSIKIARAYF